MTAISDTRIPSTLAPASLEAALLHEVSVVLLVAAAAVFVGTMLVLAWTFRRRARRAVPTSWWVIGGGIALPVVLLTALLVYSTLRTAGLERAARDPPLVVSVTGRLWWWEVRYRDKAGREVLLANELRLPVGRPTQLALASADVIHSLWVPELGGKRDLVPGRINHLVVTPTTPGVYRGQCAEYCGEQHAKMALHVVALTPAQFDDWLARQAAPADASLARDVLAARGARAFSESGCAACHSVRGIAEGAHRGPDLTHVAGRLHLGAGVLPNGPGAMKRWLVGVQELKPGARMPSYAHLDAATLDALAAFLEQLR